MKCDTERYKMIPFTPSARPSQLPDTKQLYIANKCNSTISLNSPFRGLGSSEEKQIINSQYSKPDNEQHYGIGAGLPLKKFADHPNTVRHYPNTNSYIMKKLCHTATGTPQQVNSHTQRGYYHGHTPCPEFQRPTGVFYQPEQYMPVFQHAITRRLEQFLCFLTHSQQNRAGNYIILINKLLFTPLI